MNTTEIDDALSPLARPYETAPHWFPDLGTISPAFMFRLVVVPDVEPEPPEYVYLKAHTGRKLTNDRATFDIAIVEWNSMWEAGPFTPDIVSRKRFPKALRWLLKVRDRNLRLIPRFPQNRYDAYAPLYHLLPAKVLTDAGLPLLKRGIWPHWSEKHHLLDPHLPADFDDRLSDAFSRHIWPLVNGRSGRLAFGDREPLRVLSHHLDFWLPYIDVVAQRRMKARGRCKVEDDDKTFDQDVRAINDANVGSGATAMRPLMGGHVWMGEEQAWEAAQELVDVADQHGALRGIIDTVKSNRAHDDFSSVWSYEREDFERKMHRKRSKVKVVFMELPETVPVYSEDTEVHERLLWGDFMTILDPKERRVAVCLRRGAVGSVDISRELGYANHSPVSKALARIRRKAMKFFDNN